MVIRITDTAWGVSRDGTGYNERIVDEKELPATVGALEQIGPCRKVFEILALSENSATVLINAQGRTVTLTQNEPYVYRPRSMDGGHYYTLVLQ